MVLVKCASCIDLVYVKHPEGCPKCGNPKYRRMSKAEQAEFLPAFQSAQQSFAADGASAPRPQVVNSAMPIGPAGFMSGSRRR